MPRYLIERTFPRGIELVVDEIVERNADDGVTWLHSYVSHDSRKTFDVYEAPNPEAIRRTAARNRLPIDGITEVRILEPFGFEVTHEGGRMETNGFAKAVVVSTDWLAEQGDAPGIVVAEVDENPDLYDEGHIPGAVKLHWKEDLQDPVERDIVDRKTLSACSASAASRTTRP